MPGRDLSHPASSTAPSRRSACITISTLSAMVSRLTREKCIPSWPIEMPSETEMVANSSGNPPAACTPFLAALASRSSDRLQGVISFQELATPIWGLAKSSSPIPTARSMPRAAVASRPSVTWRLRGLMSGASGREVMPGVQARSVPGLPGANAGLVALGIGEHPERRCPAIADQPAARRDRCGHPLLRDVVRHRDVQVDPVALGARDVHLLEPDRRADPPVSYTHLTLPT